MNLKYGIAKSEPMLNTVKNPHNPNDYYINGLLFHMTCVCSPEQYDVYDKNNNIVGYIRLRWGRLTCDYPNAQGEEIYNTYIGDEWTGMFEDGAERNEQLSIIANKILEKINN